MRNPLRLCAFPRSTPLLLGLACSALVLAACGSGDPVISVVGLELTPANALLIPGATEQFSAVVRMSDGSTGSAAIAWSATGGVVSGSGLYTAGAADGTFRVIATAEAGAVADTAAITISTPPPNLIAIELTPASAELDAGATQQFNAVGRMSDGGTQVVAIAWSATGGTITPSGLYTAGDEAGSFRVIAASAGGEHADTSQVTVSVPPPGLVAIEITPDSARLSYTATQQFTAIGRLSDGGTAPVSVTWTTTVFAGNPSRNTIDANGLFRAGAPIGRYMITATEQGGALSASVPVTVHSTTGWTASPGPAFWAPEPGVVYLCTSNHFTDDGNGRGGVASVSVSSGGGVVDPSIPYTNDGNPHTYGDGTGEVRVWCQQAWVAPVGMMGTVDVTISVESTRPGSGMAKVFTYDQPCLSSDCRASFNTSLSRDFTPNWTTAPVSITVPVSATTGANIWFKNTYVP